MITDIYERYIYNQAIELWGADLQINMVFEEIGELTTVLSRYIRGRATKEDVASEIADVRIMLKQLDLLLDI
ncbi:MAG: hypothetical protein ACFFDT_00325 [Candidatus Hodarchaeota archaeon]